MTRLDNAQFMKELTKLVQNNNGKSSIYLTQKRLTSDPQPNDLPHNVIPPTDEDKPANETTYPLLVRVAMNSSDNKKEKQNKVKISTVVENNQLDQFWADYVQVLKNGFIGLKKKDKRRAKRAK
ncbi:Signal recognition particle subunit SRP14 [Candida viswanathii]|uniref:Signal recognition particle subunit SRP14 n=1 Tax=Candida viswanathii TaxID=5486 RepID=A0A367XZ11_9ASCO|nr:Signal recognition particle subunit SRP14 [Candida viswanathii]